jgi:ribokinase
VPNHGDLPAELFAVDVLTPNIVEACQLTGRKIGDAKALRNIATDLIGRGAKAVVITLDHLGAVVATADGEIERLHPYKVEWVNSTAAGDAFTGALAVAMSRDLSLTDAARFANAAGALACTKDGAIDAIPTADEVRMLMNDQPH